MKTQKEFVYTAKYNMHGSGVLASLINHALSKDFIINKKWQNRANDVSVKEIIALIQAHKDESSFSYVIDDAYKTQLEIYLKVKNDRVQIDKIDVTDYNKNYGREAGQRVVGQPNLQMQKKVLLCKDFQMPSTEIMCALINYAHMISQSPAPKETPENIEKEIERFKQMQREINMSISPEVFTMARYLDDQYATAIYYVYSEEIYSKNPTTKIKEIDVTEYELNYGEGSAQKAMDFYQQNHAHEKASNDGDGK
ncbi:MAG: hypothetical protein IJ817_00885 [Clostridia bacterium]|nr:hypothetical protein [Clostridia bacterium]